MDQMRQDELYDLSPIVQDGEAAETDVRMVPDGEAAAETDVRMVPDGEAAETDARMVPDGVQNEETDAASVPDGDFVSAPDGEAAPEQADEPVRVPAGSVPVSDNGSQAISATAAELVQAYIDCRSKLIRSGTDVGEVIQKYLDAMRYGAEWGFSTVIIPVTEALAEHLYSVGDGQPLQIDRLRQKRRETLQSGLPEKDGRALLDEAYRYKIRYMAERNIDVDSFLQSTAQGSAVNCFSSFVSRGKMTCDIVLAQIPTRQPWEVFVWLPVGGVNGAPADEDLMAISEEWYRICGAVPAVLGYGTVEYYLPDGQLDRRQAAQIAMDQFAVCPERVLRLTRSHCLGELADTLTKSCVWYLGWK